MNGADARSLREGEGAGSRAARRRRIGCPNPVVSGLAPRVPPEVEPFFHGVGFAVAVVGPQGFVVRGRGNRELLMAGAATAGAGHDLRRLGLG